MYKRQLVTRGQQGEGRRVDAFAAERLAEQGGDGFVGVTGVAAALQHAGVARFDTEREDVGRDVGPRFADHADHAERNPPFDDGHSVGPGAPLQLFALRRGQVRDGFHVVGDGGDALRSQPQTVAQRRVGGHGFEVAGVGFEQAGRCLLYTSPHKSPPHCNIRPAAGAPCRPKRSKRW